MIRSGNLYSDLSGYYDLFCADVDYGEQCAFAKRVYDCFALSGGYQYLDLACGTGAHVLPMQSYGFTATGLDNSADMLAQAARRCPDAEFILSDMSALDVSNCYDLISCFLYSIHYSHPVSAFRLTLKRVFDALKPGGVFLFNTVDIKGINNRHFVNAKVQTRNTELNFSSGWTYIGHGELMDLHLSISQQSIGDSVQPSDKLIWQDTHAMTAISVHDLIRWLQETGFEVTLLEHDYSRLLLWSGNTFNIIIVACKPQ